MSALRISARIPEHPAIVFFTDGHEAPPLRSDFVPIVPDDATDILSQHQQRKKKGEKKGKKKRRSQKNVGRVVRPIGTKFAAQAAAPR